MLNCLLKTSSLCLKLHYLIYNISFYLELRKIAQHMLLRKASWVRRCQECAKLHQKDKL